MFFVCIVVAQAVYRSLTCGGSHRYGSSNKQMTHGNQGGYSV